MGLVEKVEAEIDSIPAKARECIGSRRSMYYYCSKEYCLLSHPSSNIYCPLQKDNGRLAECMYKEYMAELTERNTDIRKG